MRTLKIGAVCVAAIVVFVFAADGLDYWAKARESLTELEDNLDFIDVDKTKRAGLMRIVPVFEMPEKQEVQKSLLRDKLTEQLKGINSQPLKVMSIGKSRQLGYKLLRLKCSGKCRFTQVLDLLAKLKENPYLVGVEELRIRCDAKNPRDVEFDLTVSTFVK